MIGDSGLGIGDWNQLLWSRVSRSQGDNDMQKVGIIGSASVGQTLAQGFKKYGYEVRIGSRTPSKLSEFSARTGIQAAAFAEVAAWAGRLGARDRAARTAVVHPRIPAELVDARVFSAVVVRTNPQSPIGNPQSSILNPQSPGIADSGSEIGDRGFRIGDPDW